VQEEEHIEDVLLLLRHRYETKILIFSVICTYIAVSRIRIRDPVPFFDPWIRNPE
jgi:hypothetical protein